MVSPIFFGIIFYAFCFLLKQLNLPTRVQHEHAADAREKFDGIVRDGGFRASGADGGFLRLGLDVYFSGGVVRVYFAARVVRSLYF